MASARYQTSPGLMTEPRSSTAAAPSRPRFGSSSPALHAQQGAGQCAERLGLVLGKVAVLDRLDLATLILQRTADPQPDDVVLSKAAKLREYLARELAILEPDTSI